MSFKTKLQQICFQQGVSPTKACIDIGLSNGVYARWDDSSVPRKQTLKKFADYFSVPVSYFTEEEPEPQGETLSEQEKALIRLFRETTEDGRLEMIAAMVNIRNRFDEQKKTASAV